MYTETDLLFVYMAWFSCGCTDDNVVVWGLGVHVACLPASGHG